MKIRIHIVETNPANKRQIAVFTDEQGEYTPQSVQEGLVFLERYDVIIAWQRSMLPELWGFIQQALKACEKDPSINKHEWEAVSISPDDKRTPMRIMHMALKKNFDNLFQTIGVMTTIAMEDYHIKSISDILDKKQGDTNFLMFHDHSELLKPGYYVPFTFTFTLMANHAYKEKIFKNQTETYLTFLTLCGIHKQVLSNVRNQILTKAKAKANAIRKESLALADYFEPRKPEDDPQIYLAS